MTVNELSKLNNFTAVNISDGERKINGVYCGDLLSWVMGRAEADDAWITIMSNVNIIAVASLSDVSCIILSENVEIDDETSKIASQKQINILKTSLTTYEASVFLSKVI